MRLARVSIWEPILLIGNSPPLPPNLWNHGVIGKPRKNILSPITYGHNIVNKGLRLAENVDSHANACAKDRANRGLCTRSDVTRGLWISLGSREACEKSDRCNPERRQYEIYVCH